MKIPNDKTAIKILKQYHNPVHIIRHCVKVAKVAVFIGNMLRETGCNISIPLLQAGGLLHDVAKYKSVLYGGDHAIIGAKIITDIGYEDVARIVESHVHLDPTLLSAGQICEELVVNYADKRVKHTSVVSLEERFEDLFKRYGHNEKSIKRIDELYRQGLHMEKIIFDRLDIKPIKLNIIFRRNCND